MCKESLERVVLQKFNEANPKWQCKHISDIQDEIKMEMRQSADRNAIKQKYKTLLQGIRICDPAVGSGHFLVSALNAMIQIHYDLHLINSDITHLEIIDDEIDIADFSYKRDSQGREYQIQKELFTLKQSIIENNLFGVDINPNSVEICRLRLWIELLKNSYYLTQGDEGYESTLSAHIHQMQTLPNIDINIKCGNSLLSNIALDIAKDKLEKQLKDLLQSAGLFTMTDKVENNKKQTLVFSYEIKAILNDLKNKLPRQIEIYKEATNAYKNETHKDLKAQHKCKIQSAKDFILNLFVKTHPTYREFKILFAEYLKTYGCNGIDNARMVNIDIAELQEWQNKLNTYINDFNFHQIILDIPKADDPREFVERDFIALVKSMNAYENIANEAKSSFEWRFAFPEVLDENGDFMGFDLVIGNPPYGADLSKEDREKYKQIYKLNSTNTAQLFILLGDKITSPNGINTFIVPKSLAYVAKWKPLREVLNPNLYLLADCGKAWNYVKLEMVIYVVHKNHKYENYKSIFFKNSESSQSQTQSQSIIVDKKLIDLFGIFVNGLTKRELDLGIKICKNCKQTLLDFAECYRGDSFQKFMNEDSKGYKVLGGNEIQRYTISGVKGYIDKNKIGEHSTIKDNGILLQRIISHIDNPTSHIKFTGTITNDKSYKIVNTIFQIICKEDISNKFILGLFHSKLINWYAHRFAYAKAIRSMDFSNEVAGKIPIPKIDSKNRKIADEIANLVDTILESKNLCHTELSQESEVSQSTKEIFCSAQNDNKDISVSAKPQYDTKIKDLQSQIDSLVYALYGLDSHEIGIIKNS
ncbi:Eco57I restriction-modification methylase domain-containing protein [Helicobacter sp. 23-1048]